MTISTTTTEALSAIGDKLGERDKVELLDNLIGYGGVLTDPGFKKMSLDEIAECIVFGHFRDFLQLEIIDMDNEEAAVHPECAPSYAAELAGELETPRSSSRLEVVAFAERMRVYRAIFGFDLPTQTELSAMMDGACEYLATVHVKDDHCRKCGSPLWWPAAPEDGFTQLHEWENGSYSLTMRLGEKLDRFVPILEEADCDTTSSFWHYFAEYLWPELMQQLESDSESSMFCMYSNHREPLAALQSKIEATLRDPELVEETIAEGRAEGHHF